MAPGATVTTVLAGSVVGFLVGLTGIGGGILLLPLMTSVLGVPPIIAVGSDAVVNCVTKIGAGLVHWRRGNVRWRLIALLLLGSIPGAVAGVLLLNLLHITRGSGVNNVLRFLIAGLLIVIPLISLFARKSADPAPPPSFSSIKHRYGIVLIGLTVGLLVGLSSIGSGTVTLMLLLLFYGFAPALLVGTDVIHAVLLTGVTALLQMRLGNVDFRLIAYILMGSIPGGVAGAYVANRIPSRNLKQILFIVLIAFGGRMFWEGMANAK